MVMVSLCKDVKVMKEKSCSKLTETKETWNKCIVGLGTERDIQLLTAE